MPTARWLTSEEGQQVVAAAAAALARTGDTLQAGEAARAWPLPPDRAAAAVSCAVARQAARDLVGGADRLLFTQPAWEQASHPDVSRWRAARFAGATWVADLCSGCGGDALALAAAGTHVVAVDRDQARCVLLDHNAAVRDAPVTPVVADARHPPLRALGLVHCDPSRRTAGRRAARLADYRPPVAALQPVLAAADGAGLVLSPAVALDDPDLPPDGELEFVQHGQDLLEAVVWLGELRHGGVGARATLLPAGVTLTRTGPAEQLAVGAVGEWLLEVQPAAVRARLHDVLGRPLGARRLARRRALLTTDERPPASVWWRRWRVEAVLPPRPVRVRRWLRGADARPLEIATAGVTADPTRWWRELGRPPRGPDGRRLLLVRLDRGARALVLGGPNRQG